MPPAKPIQAHCNTCGGLRNHRVLKKVTKTWDEPLNDRYTVWSESEYLLSAQDVKVSDFGTDLGSAKKRTKTVVH
jgi:hypothetical protein